MEHSVIIEMENIVKRYGGTVALDNMNLTLRTGKIHALIGENGAGKSTLMKVLSGAVMNDEGTININGEMTKISSPRVSISKGVSVIYQEFMLAPDLSVAENIFIDRLAEKGILVNWKKLRKDAKEILHELGFDDIDPNEPVKNLSVAYQQVVEICKSLSRDAKVLVLDEPSAVLTFTEIDKLFILLRKLRDNGISIVYISHRLNEIFELCDEITVMKDGAYVGHYGIDELNKQQLVEKMVGRELSALFPKRNAQIGDVALNVEGLTAGKMVQNVSFTVRCGEVVGFSGLVGAGRTETMRAVFGADQWSKGKVELFGREVRFKTPTQALLNKVGLLPEDRKGQGVLLKMPIQWNATMTILNQTAKGGIINRNKDAEMAKDSLAKLKTKYGKLEDSADSLSGGNQQKVALAKWLAAGCEVIVLDEPTRGVDVGAKAEIYKDINDLAESGVAIIVVSSELEEIINMCDRAYVMRQGHLVGELAKEELKEVNLMNIAVGVS